VTTEQLAFPTASAIAELMAGDPRHVEEFTVMFGLIQADADAHDGIVNPNRIREQIPTWVYSRVRSSAYSALVNRGLLVPTGEWVSNTDAKGRNVGKQQKLYRLTERIA
jgi:hypothetical protein